MQKGIAKHMLHLLMSKVSTSTETRSSSQLHYGFLQIPLHQNFTKNAGSSEGGQKQLLFD
jgi:hypothetical protein